MYIEDKKIPLLIEKIKNEDLLVNVGNLSYKGLLLLIKTIISLERPGLEEYFLPADSNAVNPIDPKFIFRDNTTNFGSIPDIVTYKIALWTAANAGGSKQPHQRPVKPVPIPISAFKAGDQTIRQDIMLYDITVEFDFFSKTETQLLDFTDWWRNTFFQYRDFIRIMGCGEFIFRSQFNEGKLVEKYSKYSVATMRMQYYIKLMEFYLNSITQTKEMKITINEEVKKTIKFDENN